MAVGTVHRLKHWWRRRKVARAPIPQADWEQVTAGMPQLAGLHRGEMDSVRETATLFLHDKVFYGAEAPVEPGTRVTVAALAGLLVLGLDYDALKGWTSIVVYRGGFRARHEHMDDAGVVHDEASALSGEAWDAGPLVLSEDDIRASVAALDGYNLVVHELAHKLDMGNGEANGYPPLHAGMGSREWADVFTQAYQALEGAVDRGEPPALDPYALESPAEFFAVASEAFFECPAALAAQFPDMYRLLCDYYRQDPGRRLS